jgi:hypothetical protein
VAVLKLRISWAAGTQDASDRICSHLALIKKGLHELAGFPKKRFSPERFLARLMPPFFLALATTQFQVLTLAEQAKAGRPCKG